MIKAKDIERIFLNMYSFTDRLEDLQRDLMPDSLHVELQVKKLRATLQHIEREMETEIKRLDRGSKKK